MSFLVDTSNRSSEMEIMDDFTMEGVLFRDTLDKLKTINRFLGGNSVTINGIKKLLKNQSKNKTITIIDLGCGNGDMLRYVSKFGRKNNYSFKLIGIDANYAAIEYAKELSKEYTEIYFKKMVEIRNKTNFKELSMGMSNDYLLAAKNSATYVRIGSKIFGERN